MNKRKHTLIIAEAGVNHNGDLTKAKALIDAAVDAGVDLVKFQTFRAEDLVSKEAKQASYQKRNMNSKEDSQFQMLKQLELSHEDHEELIGYCNEKGIEFFSTAFDVKGLEYLNSLGFGRFKIPSGEITNYPYLMKLAEIGKPVILSTGMANLEEIREAMQLLETGIQKEDIIVLHCNTEYPTPMQDVNLKAMNTIGRVLNVKFGYSDHTLGIEVPIAAVALGATVIEKHFTLDRNLPGPDHRASLEPSELKAMVSVIRNIEMAISGDGKKYPSKSESKNRIAGRKSLYYSKSLPKNHTLDEDDFLCLRPGDGVSPMEMQSIIGKQLKQNVQGLDKFNFSDT
jgi:N,N'-diacetyllegionaminate synthase